MTNLLDKEPALLVGALNAVIALAVGFGLHISPAQVGLINGAVAAVLALIIRGQVSSPATVARVVKAAKAKKAT